jgi:hypothetical protein
MPGFPNAPDVAKGRKKQSQVNLSQIDSVRYSTRTLVDRWEALHKKLEGRTSNGA